MASAPSCSASFNRSLALLLSQEERVRAINNKPTMNTLTRYSSITATTLVAGTIALLALIFSLNQPSVVTGSTTYGNDYAATTTIQATWILDGFLTSTSTATNGTLGSVVITGAAAGTINIYDATTTNINLRAASMSTSSILLATMPASAAAGTYTFDRRYYNGLIVNIVGAVPTTTITYR